MLPVDLLELFITGIVGCNGTVAKEQLTSRASEESWVGASDLRALMKSV